MVSFIFYDLAFLVLFSIFLTLFLYKRRKKLKREMGIMFLYKTKIGIKAINYIGDKYQKTLHVLKYFAIASGYFLMAGMLYMLGNATYLYVRFPKEIVSTISAPPIAPLIPYFPKIFGMENIFPPFYFAYFIIALAIVAFVHEFSHGIYMRLFKIRIKSTGFAALGPILGAFVEEDRGQFEKKKNLEQMAVLSAGTFANVIFALIFFVLLIGFFSTSFYPGGYYVRAEYCSAIPVALISGFNQTGNFTEVYVGNKTLLMNHDLEKQLQKNVTSLVVCLDVPSYRAGLKGKTIVQADDTVIKTQNDFLNFLETKKPGESVELRVKNTNKEIESYNLPLIKTSGGKATIGIPTIVVEPKGFMGKIVLFFINFKTPTTTYEPRFDGDFAWFVYYLFFWVALINFFVALFNMLPLGILDGGRFFYLTVLSITKSEKISKSIFKWVGYLILLMFALIMVSWAFAF